MKKQITKLRNSLLKLEEATKIAEEKYKELYAELHRGIGFETETVRIQINLNVENRLTLSLFDKIHNQHEVYPDLCLTLEEFDKINTKLNNFIEKYEN